VESQRQQKRREKAHPESERRAFLQNRHLIVLN
jgi:hypothetical protein